MKTQKKPTPADVSPSLYFVKEDKFAQSEKCGITLTQGRTGSGGSTGNPCLNSKG